MLPALGLVELRGLVGAIEAADAMLKAADVKLIGSERISSALITIKVTGEVAAVKASVEAGAAAAQRVGQLIATHVIPRPDESLFGIMPELNGNNAHTERTQSEQEEKKAPEYDSTIPSAKKTEENAVKKSDADDKPEPGDKPKVQPPPLPPPPPIKEENESTTEPENNDTKDEKIDTGETEITRDHPEEREDLTEKDSSAKKEKEKPVKKQREKRDDNYSLFDYSEEPEDTLPDDIPEDSIEETTPVEDTPTDEEEPEDNRDSEELPEEKPEQKKDTETIAESEQEEQSLPDFDEVADYNVHQLRKLARSIDNFPIKGREISRANRNSLLDYLKPFLIDR